MSRSIGPFEPNECQFSTYVSQVKAAFVDNKTADDEKVPVFVSLIGISIYQLLVRLCSPVDPLDKTFDEVVDILSQHFEQQSLEVDERSLTEKGLTLQKHVTVETQRETADKEVVVQPSTSPTNQNIAMPSEVNNQNGEEVTTNDTTELSRWQKVLVNDNPSDRFNCFITTAAGLLGLKSIKEVEVKSNYSPIVKETLFASKNFNIDRKRGAYMEEIIPFYKDLGIEYVRQFVTSFELIDYFDCEVQNGEKRKFALSFFNIGSQPENVAERTRAMGNAEQSGQTISQAMGHVVSVRVDKTDSAKVTYIVTDHQMSSCKEHSKHECHKYHRSKFMSLHYDDERNAFFRYATPPFHLFEKIVYNDKQL